MVRKNPAYDFRHLGLFLESEPFAVDGRNGVQALMKKLDPSDYLLEFGNGLVPKAFDPSLLVELFVEGGMREGDVHLELDVGVIERLALF